MYGVSTFYHLFHLEPFAKHTSPFSILTNIPFFKHYKIDRNGIITWANLIIATGNNLAMNKGITQAARYFIRGNKITEPMLNRVEGVIRTFDPCLSCSTHANGDYPLQVQLVGPKGEVLDEAKRG